jgi:hypothetical protein
LVGRWKVTWTCGTEELHLKEDGTYSYSIQFERGGQLPAPVCGDWFRRANPSSVRRYFSRTR